MSDKKQLKKEDINELNILKANYQMLMNTLKEARKKSDEQTIKLIEIAKQEVVDHIKSIDESAIQNLVTYDEQLTLDDKAQNLTEPTLFDSLTDSHPTDNSTNDKPSTNNAMNFVDDSIESDFITDVQYDMIPLPSNGQCYKNKKSRLPVGYLTAYDENMITSPNLYQNGMVTDLLLKNKVLDKDINVEELCSGDVDAIMLFLRVTSYGSEFPIEVIDPETNTKIETNVDLSELKTKEFVLEGDENGYFDYELPVTKDKVKFKFLTRHDERVLLQMSKVENNGVKAELIKSSIKTVEDIIAEETSITSKDKKIINDNLHKIDPLVNHLLSKHNAPYTQSITNKLIMSIMSINGNSDKDFIRKYVMSMQAKDSLMLRRYMIENEPGINFEITVNRPMSLGGGSFKTFLKWDDFIFLNIA